ncbi:hypothetical protein CC86DRAFT_402862 [Ophiobolus disseminans]|uniref:Uncharacterized protein n=1 Tax=Ophiobolus disseminans TaxID=1469910 RepID=A0A6A7ADX0_9PLEO|nr:hypothetical protein CC86DRAFT_402862 [Ophiobolus disseminans]
MSPPTDAWLPTRPPLTPSIIHFTLHTMLLVASASALGTLLHLSLKFGVMIGFGYMTAVPALLLSSLEAGFVAQQKFRVRMQKTAAWRCAVYGCMALFCCVGWVLVMGFDLEGYNDERVALADWWRREAGWMLAGIA